MKIASCIVLIVALLLSSMTHALDWEFQPRITTGVQQYQYKQHPVAVIPEDDSAPGLIDGIEVDDIMFFVGVGTIAHLDKFSVGVSFQRSEKGNDNLDQTNRSTSDNQANFVTLKDFEREMEREEFSLSVGYTVTERLTVFAGYKQTETHFEDHGQELLIAVNDDGSLSEESLLPFQVVIDEKLDQDGYFIGAGYYWPFEYKRLLSGALSIDLGVAFLDGKVEGKGKSVFLGEIEGTRRPTKTAGESTGVNVGITWTGPLTDRLGYSLGVDYYDYSFDGGNSADFDDTLFRFTLGLSYVFGGN